MVLAQNSAASPRLPRSPHKLHGALPVVTSALPASFPHRAKDEEGCLKDWPSFQSAYSQHSAAPPRFPHHSKGEEGGLKYWSSFQRASLRWSAMRLSLRTHAVVKIVVVNEEIATNDHLSVRAP